MYFFLQQIKWLTLGFISMFIISQVSYQSLKKMAYPLLLLSWILLVLGFFFKGNNPAARWLVIGGRSWMTTSDFAKLSLIIFTAFFIEKNKNYLKDEPEYKAAWLPNITYFTRVIALTYIFQLFWRFWEY